MVSNFDVIVAGGSVAGLSFASTAAENGLKVVVLEEHADIGEPEKCDGLVSLRSLGQYVAPDEETIQSRAKEGIIHSPSGAEFAVDASGLEVVVLDRSKFDRQLAEKATDAGARIVTRVRAGLPLETADSVKVQADQSYEASYFVDATGPAGSPKAGIVAAAKYEVEADWIRDGSIEVFLDKTRYPGFFAWVIPYGGKRAKVGAAGYGINSFKALDSFLDGRRCDILRRVPAPIYVGGPVSRFVNGRTILVGESAGQVKPTTAGGITTSVAGGVMAAKRVAESLSSNDPSVLLDYQRDWEKKFGKEMRTMKRLRSLFERLSNKDLDTLVTTFSNPRLRKKLAASDFDFHASALLSTLGLAGVLRLGKVLASAEMKQLASELF